MTLPATFSVGIRAAADAVARALPLVRAGSGGAEVTVKGERDLVTTTDVAVEDALRSAAAALGIDVVGEERGGTAPAGAPYWLIDPLCGTGNFAAGIPLCSVNLAVVLDGVVTAAVVGDASTGELLVAERGAGAWCLGSGPVSVSLANPAICVEPGRVTGPRRAAAASFTAAAIAADRWDVLSLNSTVSLAYVATGRVGAYVLFAPAALHVAAGTLLVTEAGGVVTDLAGAPWSLASDSLVASADAALHAELLALS